MLVATSASILGFALVRGFVLLDFYGAILFSFFGMVSALAVACSVRALSEGKRLSACICGLLAVLTLAPVAFPKACFADYPFMATMADIQRRVRSIQRELNTDPELSGVDLEFMAPSGTKQKWVQATGSVETKHAFERLKSNLERLEFLIRYNLLVGGEKIEADQP
ncbi:hypothetical protein K239x_12830 [Planctomycetes bacterium K23_9]|uniref:Uncharacterized protein n=2 Tax=Stieleria marina TaxID=1930275 RepID=A0A517NQD8_9BACT|nr:hypothetical protein K239x_12830 [Planctomycetes bacterium K23_9]